MLEPSLEEVPPAAPVDQTLTGKEKNVLVPVGSGIFPSSCYLIAISANAGWMDLGSSLSMILKCSGMRLEHEIGIPCADRATFVICDGGVVL